LKRPVYYSHDDVTVLDIIDAPVWIFDIEQHCIWWANRAAIKFWLADSLDDLLRRDFSSDSPTVRKRLRLIVDNAAPGSTIHETWTLYPRGQSISVPLTLTPVLVGAEQHDAIVIEASPFDAKALETVDRRLVEASRYTDIMITYITMDGGVISMNPSALEAFGPTANSAKKAVSFYDWFMEPASVRNLVQRCIAGEEPTSELESQTLHGRHWHRVSLRFARDPLTGESCIVAIEEDISDLKQAVVDLEELNTSLVAANKAKSEFLSSMSHELRTPLNSILGFSQLLDDDPEDPITPRHKRYVQHILDNGNHLLSLIDQVLDLSRIEAGKLVTNLTDVPIATMVTECMAMSKSLADGQGVQVRFTEEDAQNLTYRADVLQFRQVLLNLLSNAIKFNHQGGVVTIATERKEGRIRLTISDTGVGIPAEKLMDVFEPFNRLGFEASQIQGTGIGLSIAKRLIDVMGGSIGASSEHRVGSTFWIELPTASPE